MTAHPKGGGLIFDSTSGDPGRARALTEDEFTQLTESLETTVLLLLQAAADSLCQKPLITADARSGTGWAELRAAWSDSIVQGRLRIDIHSTFANLVPRKPIFWVYTIYRDRTATRDGDLMACESQRLVGFDDLMPLQNALDGFVSVFLTAIPR